MSQRSHLYPIIFTTLLLFACGQSKPEVPPARSTTPKETTTISNHIDTLPPSNNTDTSSHAVTGAVPQLTQQTRAELIADVDTFITRIDSGDQNAFWKMLAQRSRQQIERGELVPKDEIWNAVRQTLGDVRDRHISIVGGTPDSVALLVEGLRNIDSERVADPVIIHLLREGSTWKVMYPGLLYPMHHLRR